MRGASSGGSSAGFLGIVPRMKTHALGKQGPGVGEIGLGCVGMSAFDGDRDEGESLAPLDRALELGVTLLDTSDIYGPSTNEALLGRARPQRGEAAMLPPSTVKTQPVVLGASARWTKAAATSSASTSRASRLLRK